MTINPAKRAEVVRMVRDGATVHAAAKALGVTYYAALRAILVAGVRA